MSKRFLRDCPIPNCGAKSLVKLSNHLTDVHELSSAERKHWLQEAKRQPKLHYHQSNDLRANQPVKTPPLRDWITL